MSAIVVFRASEFQQYFVGNIFEFSTTLNIYIAEKIKRHIEFEHDEYTLSGTVSKVSKELGFSLHSIVNRPKTQ